MALGTSPTQLGGMAWRCLFPIVACISFLLHGCTGPKTGFDLVPTSGKRVIVMRHCVRTTGKDSKPYTNHANVEVKASDLTAMQFPAVLADEEKRCTEEGKKIIQGTGAFIKEQLEPNMSSLNVVIDADAARDVTTARFLAEGMGMDISSIGQWDASVFLTVKDGACTHVAKGPTDDRWDAQYHKVNYDKLEMPMGIGLPSSGDFAANWNKMLAELENIIGSSGTYKVTEALRMDQSNLPSPQEIIKACAILKFFAQQFLYSFASGTTWGLEDPTQIFRWAGWIYYSRQVKYSEEELVTKGLTITNSVITDLDTDPMPFTIYVGHDTQLDELEEFFDLKWELDGYGPYGTPPGSGFVFTREEGETNVRVQYMYPVFDGSPDQVETMKVLDISPRLTLDKMKGMYQQKWSDPNLPWAQVCKQALDEAIKNNKNRFDPSR